MAVEMAVEYDIIEAKHRAQAMPGKLDEQDRYLVSVAYGIDATKKSVSERLGMIPSRFYKILNRIRQQLHKCIQYRLVADGRGMNPEKLTDHELLDLIQGMCNHTLTETEINRLAWQLRRRHLLGSFIDHIFR